MDGGVLRPGENEAASEALRRFPHVVERGQNRLSYVWLVLDAVLYKYEQY